MGCPNTHSPAFTSERARTTKTPCPYTIPHATRVRAVAYQVATQHPATVDQELLAAAAWCHDIGRSRERGGKVNDPGDLAVSNAIRLLNAKDVPAEQGKGVHGRSVNHLGVKPRGILLAFCKIVL
ncbi:hypothetical protein SAMN05216218_1364 [Halorientalis regularis]|jgi:HD superfamily phosphodiesterase|uniref:HD domain-containing protein n=1 Tax=Halorientalis regularis TaxID=660518 RepID=A0A1G7U2I5_9EURY|nr:hypothetical protein SAMN05216218_1364 [Halorientalis regularis]